MSSFFARQTCAAELHATPSISAIRPYAIPGQPSRLVIHFHIAPGWHIYGVPPGDAGFPPAFDIHTTPAATVGAMQWPAADKWQQGSVTANIYSNDVDFPFDITPAHALGSTLHIVANANWLVCRDICVPESTSLELNLPWQAVTPNGHATAGVKSALELPAGNLTLLLLAMAGGLLLNLMPCVFPVLALKAIGVARLAGAQELHVRRQAASYAIGIISGFTAFGLVLTVLRAIGFGLDWGGQFQHPAFVAAMAWLLFLLGLSLAGLLNFAESGFLWLSGWVGSGDMSSLGSGALAVLVAAPCTGPLMGAVTVAALNGPAWFLIASLTAMGLGMALPGLLLAGFPRLARFLPRPGLWMVQLKQLLAFPMFASALWLIWVLDRQAGPDGLLRGLAGLWGAGLGVWALHAASERQPGAARRILLLLAIMAFAAPLPLLPALRQAAKTSPRDQGAWEAFSESRLAALRAAHRPVLVDMTADWCLICLVNDRTVLDTAPMQTAFQARHVILLRGDWTNGDPALTNFLRQAGRDGVPLYIYYPTDAAPVVLPQVLTNTIVLNQINKTP